MAAPTVKRLARPSRIFQVLFRTVFFSLTDQMFHLAYHCQYMGMLCYDGVTLEAQINRLLYKQSSVNLGMEDMTNHAFPTRYWSMNILFIEV